LIRTGVDEVRIAGRSTRGVTLFRVGDDERVVTVTHLRDDDDEEDGEAPDGGSDASEDAETGATDGNETPQDEPGTSAETEHGEE
jgi:DNA gyrase subunit A